MFSCRLKYAAIAAALSVILCSGCSLFHKKEATQDTDTGKTTEEVQVIASGEGGGPVAQDSAVHETNESPVPADSDALQGKRDDSEAELGGIPVISGDYEISDCIELPDIMSIEGNYVEDKLPTREEARIYAMLQKDAHRMDEDEEDLLAQYGDSVNIDLIIEEGEDDLASGSILGMDVAVGAGDVDEKIEKTINGMTLGQEREVTVEDENGKTTYKVILRSIARPEEPTDAEISDALSELTEESTQLNKYNRYASLKREVVEKSVVRAYPEKLVRQARALYEDKYLRGGLTLNDYLDQAGMTKAEFKGYEDEYAMNMAKELLVLEALSEKTGITKDSEEYRILEEEEGENPEDPDALLYRLILDRLFEDKADSQ